MLLCGNLQMWPILSLSVYVYEYMLCFCGAFRLSLCYIRYFLLCFDGPYYSFLFSYACINGTRTSSKQLMAVHVKEQDPLGAWNCVGMVGLCYREMDRIRMPKFLCTTSYYLLLWASCLLFLELDLFMSL
jgi:hypothetical protein